MTHVVGLDHWIQPAPILNGDEEVAAIEREQKQHFRTMLTAMMEEGRPGLVGEETRQGENTIAAELAAANGIRYRNIDMTVAQRAQADIPPYYEAAYRGQPTEVARCHTLREEFMVRQVQQERPENEPAIVLCGFSHLDALHRLFLAEHEDVVVHDLRDTEWFCGDLLQELFRRQAQ